VTARSPLADAHRRAATALREQAAAEDARAAALDAQEEAGPCESATASGCLPEYAPRRGVRLPDLGMPRATPAEERSGAEARLQGPAAPSTLEVYLDRWTHYFATDPDWCSVFCLFYAKGGAEPEPLAHEFFCRRLAAALAPMWVEPSGAPSVKSWGPAPPATSEDYGREWAAYVVAMLDKGKASSVEPVPVIPPPPVTPSASLGESPASHAGPSSSVAPPHDAPPVAVSELAPAAPSPSAAAEAPASPSPAPRPDDAMSPRADAVTKVAERRRAPGALKRAAAETRACNGPPASVEASSWYDQDTVPIARRAYLDLCRQGELRSRKVGKKVLVRRADLDTWIETHGGPERRPAEAPPPAPAEPSVDDLLRSAGIVLRNSAGKGTPPTGGHPPNRRRST
jgi:excisionase family DNA binding protein